MYLCYIDESGTSAIPGNTSHFILAGIAIPIWRWQNADNDIAAILSRYGLGDAELHTAWLLRKYIEQKKIPNFERLNRFDRRTEVERFRRAEILKLQRSGNSKAYKQIRKNYRHTEPYIHLTLDERKQLVTEVANKVSSWGFARVFAECIDKIYFDPARSPQTIDEQAFEQLVSRFETYLQKTESNGNNQNYGLLVHDNNQTVAKKHTEQMRKFHNSGTLWTNLNCTIETPMFVDSSLTRMVQIADLCSYSIRRFLENGETQLFDLIYDRADRFHDKVVGVRHFSDKSCSCRICQEH